MKAYLYSLVGSLSAVQAVTVLIGRKFKIKKKIKKSIVFDARHPPADKIEVRTLKYYYII